MFTFLPRPSILLPRQFSPVRFSLLFPKRILSCAVGSTTYSIAYGYNANHDITSLTDARGKVWTFEYFSDDSIKTETDPLSHSTTYGYFNGSTLITDARGSASKFYKADGIGTTRALTSASGMTTDTLSTDAFGNTVSSTGTSPSPFGFVGGAGYQSDSDTGLMLLGHRYYDPSTGRFLSRDPAMAGYNWYTYCNNDPVNTIDTTGLDGVQVPPAPPNANLRKNVGEAKLRYDNEMVAIKVTGDDSGLLLADLLWFKDHVRAGGDWDYKQQGGQYENYGNFNYGAVGAALGIPDEVLLRMAGYAQYSDQTSNPKWGNPLGGPPYGDDPKDQHWIKEGIRYYREVIMKGKK